MTTTENPRSNWAITEEMLLIDIFLEALKKFKWVAPSTDLIHELVRYIIDQGVTLGPTIPEEPSMAAAKEGYERYIAGSADEIEAFHMGLRAAYTAEREAQK